MLSRIRPYVGVSGVVNPEQQTELTNHSYDELTSVGRKLALGIKANHRTQYDAMSDPHGELWYPVGDAITTAVDARRETMIIAQVALRTDLVAIDETYADRFMETIVDRTSDYLDAIQVDMCKYEKDPIAFGRIIRAMSRTGMQKILQCHVQAGGSPQKAIDSIKTLSDGYEINYLLFDASHGDGRAINADRVLPYLDAAYSDKDFHHSLINFGVAGGLDATTVGTTINKLLQYHNDISWDAEARLHTPILKGSDGSLDIDTTKKYLSASTGILPNHL